MQLLSNMKVGTRLGVLSMVAVLGIGTLLGVSLSSLSKLRVGGPIYQEIVTNKDLLADILPPPAYVIESYLNCHEIADITDPADLTAAIEKAKRLRQEYETRLAYWADNLPAGPAKDSLLSQAAVPAKQLFIIRDEQLIPLIQAGKNDEARELVEKQIEPLFRTHDAAIRTCVEFATKDAARTEESSAASTARLTGVIWGAGGVLIIAVGAISWLIARSVTRPLSTVRDAVGRLAQGDLTVELKLGHKDEIGQLADSVDHTAGSLRQMIGDVGSTSRQVAAASTQIAASAEEMAAGLKSQEDQTARLAAAAEEMSASVVEVAKKGQEATQAAETSGQTADNGGTVVQRTIEEMRGISTQVEQSAAAIVDLGARSEQIGRIIGVINDIADQTNLLALNAAIEAARAGEHGRGFAVVADEVRKLAERTTQATDEVARSIRDMQTGTQGAVTKIQEGKSRVSKGVELAQDAGAALSQILVSSKQVREMVQSIAVSAAEQSSASSEIARGVESISAVTRESNEAARQSAQAAAELSSQAERLNAMIGRFKV